MDTNFEKVLLDFENFRKKTKYIFYCDTGDSSGWIEKKIFPFVDKYLKCQLLKNKNLYKTKIYGKKGFFRLLFLKTMALLILKKYGQMYLQIKK